MRPSPDDLAVERTRRDLRRFVEWAWPFVDPTEFAPGIHIDLICAALEQIARGDCRRLLINVPPRHGKTLLVMVMFPAWLWASRPETRFLTASYGSDLAVRDAWRMRRLVESDAYRRRWGQNVRLLDDQNTKQRFENDRGGARVAVSIGGAATGEGGDIILIDDPLKIELAESVSEREAVKEWYNHTALTRQNNPQDSSIIVIGQRLHEDDLFGHLLDQDGWTHLCLPARYESAHPHRSSDDPRIDEGELLWPEHVTDRALTELESALGSYRAAGMLQQRPAPTAGGIFQRKWWRYYTHEQKPKQFTTIIQSWDLAFTDTAGSDYVVGQVWATHGSDAYLLRQVRDRLDFTQTLAAIRSQTNWIHHQYPRTPHHSILIEQAANGAAVINTLRNELRGVIPVRPDGDKISRAYAVTPQLEAGNIYLPGAANRGATSYDPTLTPGWVQALVEEAAVFPNGRHDDQVDALTQALRRARSIRAARVAIPPASARIPLPGHGYDPLRRLMDRAADR